MPKTKKTETTITQAYEEELSTDTAAKTGKAVPKAPPSEAEKPKRASRRKKAETKQPDVSETTAAKKTATRTDSTLAQVVANPQPSGNTSFVPNAGILTIDAYADVQTPTDVDDTVWHEIQNAYVTRKILTGILGGLEKLDSGNVLAVLDYKGFRVAIPVREMYVNLPNDDRARADSLDIQHRYLSMMLGAEIDFVVRGIDSNSKSVVGSRRDAMLKKRQTFYVDRDSTGKHLVYPGRIVQGRIIATSEKFIRVEIFGVDTNVYVRNLAWYWIGDAKESYSIGDTILLRIESITGVKVSDIRVTAEARSLSSNTNRDHLMKCRIQGKYAGKVTDVQKGVIFIRLSNGTNAIAHSCLDYRTPGKKDDVSFVVTKLDTEQNVAIGMVTRSIRQNL